MGKMKKTSFIVLDEVCKNCGLKLLLYAGLDIAIKIPRMAEILSMYAILIIS